MFAEIAYSVLAVALLLAVVIVVEQVSPLKRPISRFPGVLFVTLLPAATVALAWPMGRLWGSLGVGPLIDLTWMHPALLLIASLLLFDFLRYWEHRFEHRFFWRVHSVHHSVKDLHAANAYAHPLQAIPEFFIVSIPFSLIGTGGIPAYLALFVVLQNLIIHSPLRVHLGPLRNVIVDHRFHRIHHSTEPRHFDRNFALVFSFWDRLFGTVYFPAPDEHPETGVAGVKQPKNAAEYLLLGVKPRGRRERRPAGIAADVRELHATD